MSPDGSGLSAGHLKIPILRNHQEEKPAWIVDGQQRALAIGLACKERGLPITPFVAFIADDVEFCNGINLCGLTTRNRFPADL